MPEGLGGSLHEGGSIAAESQLCDLDAHFEPSERPMVDLASIDSDPKDTVKDTINPLLIGQSAITIDQDLMTALGWIFALPFPIHLGNDEITALEPLQRTISSNIRCTTGNRITKY